MLGGVRFILLLMETLVPESISVWECSGLASLCGLVWVCVHQVSFTERVWGGGTLVTFSAQV